MAIGGGWNYRVMRRRGTHEKFGPWEAFGVHEVFYDRRGKRGKPTGWTQDPVDVGSEGLEGVEWVLAEMAKALKRPVLDYDTGHAIEDSPPKPARRKAKRTRK